VQGCSIVKDFMGETIYLRYIVPFYPYKSARFTPSPCTSTARKPAVAVINPRGLCNPEVWQKRSFGMVPTRVFP